MLAKLEREAAARGEGCLGKAADDEPVFVLRAKDPIAPFIVREWVAGSKLKGIHSDKLDEAMACAQSMVDWQVKNGIIRL